MKGLIEKFPPHHLADEQGLIGFGGDLRVENLHLAYSNGFFPWPLSEKHPIPWFTPDPRGVLFFEDLTINRTL
jgi:leucyl/phenylalanyl-tRNA--protein transferase